MLILPNSCFLHVPKTGGSWAAKAIVASGIQCEDFRLNGDPHLGLSQCPDPARFKFAFVRHPLNWYQSYWQFKMTYGWDERNPFDLGCRSDNFLQFIENMLAGYPGFYSKGLIAFVGKGSSEIDFIGRYENLVEDLISALRMAGEGFDESIIRQMPPFNVSNKSRFPAEYRAELRQRVTETEQETMERFGY